ncbi:ParB N-terminal domain-containing protein [Pseudoalteromonas sp. L23]|uniref:ParB N-terminal domain-containing protein n=1 Tax=unclassified Pseudoalteromonas TaxID=194690 RepID=UPI001EEFC1F2|nr:MULTISPECIES: ParB N-terminal domain-containing protein [unclassified Pseudoalteromonas]MCF7513377.1 ParB N-terminal domain-containing protein [Pseudoalteromonas sp. L7]MCF7525646.1 ParB N-terminal domain-containing protein [Pseudoalteromonas sp. L23]MCX2765841.1 ParB N-terminal domain-containing protein [Pseudoalteromonas sp. B530]
MARKRKNDTRIDPFATAVEGSSLDDLLDQAKVGDVVTMPAPSDPTKTIVLTCEVVPFSEIESKTTVYGQNRREQSLLSEKAVADILPAIKKDKRNLHPALCWQHNGKLHVLSGSRRRKACMLAEADYVVLSSKDFSDEDAKTLAVSSDQYIAPSLWELGKAYFDTKHNLIKQGQKGSYREIAAVEGVSHTAIADALKAYESIPVEVLQLYPTANHLGREAAKKLITAKQEQPGQFSEQIAALKAQDFMTEEMSDEKRAVQITKFLTTFGSSDSRVESMLENDYIRVQRNLKSGDVTVKIDNRVLTDKRLEQLQKLLSSYN